MGNCKHKDTELFVKDISTIFKINYRTALNWLGESKNGKYTDGKFPNAYKCEKCGKIIIPYDDVKRQISKEL